MMIQDKLEALVERVGHASMLDAALFEEVARGVGPFFPGVEMPEGSINDPTEAALHLVDRCLPGWTISLTGKALEEDGSWKCVLRESTSRDNDAFLGTGRAPSVALALVRALLAVTRFRSMNE